MQDADLPPTGPARRSAPATPAHAEPAPVIPFPGARSTRPTARADLHVLATSSHAREARALIEALEASRPATALTVSLYLAARHDDLPALARTAARMAEPTGALIAVGDERCLGTVARSAWEHELALGVLACGDARAFAREHALPTTPRSAASFFLTAFDQHADKPVDLGRVNEHSFLFGARLGTCPQWLGAAPECSRPGTRRGVRAWFAALAAVLRGADQTPLAVSGVRPMPAEAEDIGSIVIHPRDGKLDVHCYRALARRGLARRLIDAASGRTRPARSGAELSTHGLQVAAVSGREHILVICDGDARALQAPLRFSIESRPLRLLATRQTGATEGAGRLPARMQLDTPSEHAA